MHEGPLTSTLDNMFHAISVSRPAWDLIHGGGFSGRVAGVYQQACNLESRQGDVLSLVLPSVGNGPFSIVLRGQAGLFTGLTSGTTVSTSQGQLALGEDLVVAFDRARIWEPRPGWESLRPRWQVIRRQLPAVLGLAKRLSPGESLLQQLFEPAQERTQADALAGALHARIRVAADLLRAGWETDGELLCRGAAHLAGVGPGLTPAGDDFLAGAMLGAWLAHPDPQAFCHLVLEAAAPRTTALSIAYLRAAASGHCSEPWHDLLHCVACKSGSRLEAAVRGVVAHGATSGSDTLAGLGWVSALVG